MSIDASVRIPITLVTGFLGAGKTATMMHLAEQLGQTRTLVMKSDVGDISIDDRRLGAKASQVYSVTDGHGDRSAVDQLSHALVSRAREQADTGSVLIEMSGLADPFPLLQRLGSEALDMYRLASVITVVDARRFRDAPSHASTRRRQLLAADLVVLNKTDTVSPAMLQSAHRHLAQQIPKTPIIGTTHGRVDVSVWQTLHHHKRTNPLPDKHTAPPHIHAVSMDADSDVDPMKLSDWMTHIYLTYGTKILRIKGDVAIWGQPDRYTVSAVGPDVDIRPYTCPSKEGLHSRLVVIGESLDMPALHAGFQTCLREPWKGDHSWSPHTCC